MANATEWIREALRHHPELAVFLALAGGYWVGRLKIGSFKLGAVVGCLLVGVLVGQLGITVPSLFGRAFFLLFLFSVGYKTGPQFFSSLGKSALPQIILTVLFSGLGIAITYVIARILRTDVGTAVGLLSGGIHSSEAIGTGTYAIGQLPISDDLRKTLISNATAAYAVTYLVAIFTGIFALVRIGPWLMRVDLRAECQKLENELGMKKDDPAVISAYKQFVMRAYKIPSDLNKTVEELENSFSPDRVFVERIKTGEKTIDANPQTPLQVESRIVLSGRPAVLGGSSNPLQAFEIDDPGLLDIPAITVDYVLKRNDLQHLTLAEIVTILEKDVPTRGVYLSKVMRAGEEIPLGLQVVLERGDVLTLVGAKRHVDRVAARLGPVERTSNVTDVLWLSLAIGIGGLIGLPALHVAGLNIGLQLPVGVLLAALITGWFRSRHPGFAKIPEPVIWLLDSMGLSAFVATIGINAGTGFVQGLRTTGLTYFICGFFISAIPYIVTMLVGRYVFRMHPGVLVGVCAASGTSSPALAAVQASASRSRPRSTT